VGTSAHWLRSVFVASVGAAIVAGALAGCGKLYWTKPGSTIEDFERDSTACARQTSANPTAATHGAVDMQAYRACLTAEGYVQRHATAGRLSRVRVESPVSRPAGFAPWDAVSPSRRESSLATPKPCGANI
jgi:hypothetical protein